MFYEDLEYAITRLRETYIRTAKGNLFFVEKVVRDEDYSIHCIGTEYNLNENKLVKLPLKDLDLTPIPLGFINLEEENTAVYAVRVPIRKYWRQGLGCGNLHYFTFYNYYKEGFPKPDSLVKTFFNVYPTLDQALSKVKKDRLIAFHRNWAIGEEDVFCRFKHVGQINKNGVISLSKKFSYLTPHLEEAQSEKNI